MKRPNNTVVVTSAHAGGTGIHNPTAASSKIVAYGGKKFEYSQVEFRPEPRSPQQKEMDKLWQNDSRFK